MRDADDPVSDGDLDCLAGEPHTDLVGVTGEGDLAVTANDACRARLVRLVRFEDARVERFRVSESEPFPGGDHPDPLVGPIMVVGVNPGVDRRLCGVEIDEHLAVEKLAPQRFVESLHLPGRGR